jgi:hypothetical protein
MPSTNAKILAALRKELGGVSPQAISQRRAKIQALVPMPVDIATYVIASREGVALHRELDAATLEQVADFDARLRAREQTNGQASDPPRRGRAKGKSSEATPSVKQLQIGNFTAPVGTLNPRHTTDAVRMAAVYPLLYAFENSMREYIDGHLSVTYGENWHDDPKIVSTTIKGRVERNRNAEAKHRYHSRRSARFIYYTDLGDLPAMAHSENGWKVFSTLFPSDKWLHGRVEVIEASRNVVAHMNPLQPRDIERIRINFEDWLDQIKDTRPT